MRFVQIGFGIFMISGAAALGCGGSDSPNPPASGTGGKGGSAGSGGVAGSATAGKGGAATGGSAGSGTTGGTGGMATGGTGGMSTGGGAGMTTGGGAGMATGGGSGMTGEGGEGGGGSGEECPGTAPTDGDECDSDVNPGFMDDPCVYGETECTCGGFGMNAEWSCEGGTPTMECPMAAPEDGDECDPDVNPGFMDDPCVFGDTECTCAGGGGGGGMAEWNCTMAAMCPMDAPDDGDACDNDTDPGPMDGGCQYDTTTCVCAGGGGGGMQTWNCGTCPEMAPEDEDECDNEVNGFCAYESGNCTCTMMDEWNCMN